MLAELLDALKDAGANEKKPRKAAETVAVYENRFATIETDLGILKWAVGFNPREEGRRSSLCSFIISLLASNDPTLRPSSELVALKFCRGFGECRIN